MGYANSVTTGNQSNGNQIDIDSIAGLLDYLAQPNVIEDQYHRILGELVSATNADSASLRIRDESDGTLHLVAQAEKHHDQILNVPVEPHSANTNIGNDSEKPAKISISTVTQPINRLRLNIGFLSM